MPNVTSTVQRAVVIGAGMGGLTSAKALAGHFKQVIVLERDDLPPEPQPRAGVPHREFAPGRLAPVY